MLVSWYTGPKAAWALGLPLALSFALVIVLACSERARRSHPTNIILLFAFTACQVRGTVGAGPGGQGCSGCIRQGSGTSVCERMSDTWASPTR